MPGNEQHLPEIGCGWVEFADHQAVRNHSRLISAEPGLLKQHNANRRTYFFNAIGHERPFPDRAHVRLRQERTIAPRFRMVPDGKLPRVTPLAGGEFFTASYLRTDGRTTVDHGITRAGVSPSH